MREIDDPRSAVLWSVSVVASGLLAALAGSGCHPALDPPPNVLLTCANDRECPEGWTCSDSTGLCVDGNANTAPALFIDTIPRSPAVVQIPVVLIDSDGDSVSLSMQFRVVLPSGSWSEWQQIDPSHVDPEPTALASSAAGTAHTLAWSIVATAKSIAQLGDLASTTTLSEATGAAGEESIDVVVYIPRVVVRIRPMDSVGNQSDPVESEPFAVGNTPPTASLTGWSGAFVFNRFVPIEYTLFDRAADPARVIVEYRTGGLLGTDFFSRATLIMGDNGLQPVATSSAPELRVVIWDTVEDLGPGVTTDAVVRIRAIDSLDQSRSFLSPWSVRLVPAVSND